MTGTLASCTMSTNPAIRCDISYVTERSGSNIRCRFAVSIAPVSGLSYFGYNLLASLTVNGKQVAADATMKEQSPSRWTSPLTVYFPSPTSWYTIGGITTQTSLTARFTARSSQTYGTGDTGNRTISIPAPKNPTAPNLSLSSTVIPHTSYVNLGLSGGNWGDGGAGKYLYQYRISGDWITFYSGNATKQAFYPQKYGGTYDSRFQLRVITQNGWGLQAVTNTVSVSCAGQPGSPSNFKVAPNPMRRTDTLTLSWSPPQSGAAAISKYEISVRYRLGSVWTGWYSIGQTSDTSLKTTPAQYTFFAPAAKGELQYQIIAVNGYGNRSAAAYASSAVRGGTAAVKIDGKWQEDCLAYLKIESVWKEADGIFIKAGSVWKSQ